MKKLLIINISILLFKTFPNFNIDYHLDNLMYNIYINNKIT